jgi:hypothetical protein
MLFIIPPPAAKKSSISERISCFKTSLKFFSFAIHINIIIIYIIIMSTFTQIPLLAPRRPRRNSPDTAKATSATAAAAAATTATTATTATAAARRRRRNSPATAAAAPAPPAPPAPLQAPTNEIINNPLNASHVDLVLIKGNYYYYSPPTTEDEIRSLILYLDPVYLNIYNSYKFIDFKGHIEHFINTVDILYQHPFNRTKVKLAIFNIYDDSSILNEYYGSDNNLFYEATSDLIYNIPPGSIYGPVVFNSEFHHIIDNLIYLLEFLKPGYPKDTFIMNLGSLYHATCLLFKKLKSGLIKVVHINTGLGIDVKIIKQYDKKYHRLFEKFIYLTEDMIPAFIKFIKPFLFFRKEDTSNDDLPINYVMVVMSDYIDRVLNYKIDFNRKYMKLFYNKNYNNIYDYYVDLFNNIKNNSNFTYEYLNKILTFDSLKEKLKTIGLDYTQAQYYEINKDNDNFNSNSLIFYNNFNTQKINKIQNYNNRIHLKNYIKKALNNFDIYFDETIYFTAQEAGTCMYKSLLLSMIYYLIYNNNTLNDSLILNTYVDFSEDCYNNLSTQLNSNDSYYLEKSYTLQTSNTSKIISNLIKDGIVSSELGLMNFIQNKKLKSLPFEYKIDNVKSINTENINISVIPLNNLNEMLNNIRNNVNKTSNLHRINDTISQYIKTSKFKDIHRSYCELVLLSIVWELYYNKDFWEDKINNFNFTYNNIIFLDLLAFGKFRLDFNYDEVEWISKFYIFLTFNYALYEKGEILKNILYTPDIIPSEFRIILPNSIVNYNNPGIYKEKITENNLNEIYLNNLIKEPSTPVSIPLDVTSEYLPKTPYQPNTPYIPRSLLPPNTKPGMTVGTLPPVRNVIVPRMGTVPPIRMYETSTLSRIYKYFNYLYFKADIIQENYSFINTMFDNDIFNFNRFMINHFKHNNNFHIELSNAFEKIRNNETYKKIYTKSNIINTKEGAEINNIYIFQSFIDAFTIYSVYLNEAEKYKIIKQIFISCKPINDNYEFIIVKSLILQVIELINIIIPDVFIDIDVNITYMNFKLDQYFNQYSTHIYNNNTNTSISTITKYDFSNPNSIIFLYKYLLELFEKDIPINKSSIDNSILIYFDRINSQYFNVDKKNPLLKNLVIENTIITDKFNKINNLHRNANNVERTFLLGEILNCYNRFNSYINDRRTHLVYVLDSYYYNIQNSVSAYMPENVIIVFEIKPGPTYNTLIIKDKAFINSNQIIFSYDNIINDYPFMAFSTNDTINFIEKNHNNYKLHCISNNTNDEENEFHRMVMERYDNYYVSFDIKSNFLTPIMDDNKDKYLKVFYEVFPPIKEYTKYIYGPVSENDNFKLQNLLDLNVLSDIRLRERLEEIFMDTRRDINTIIKEILNTETYPYVDLVQWINIKTNNSLTLYDRELKCDLDCRKISADNFKQQIKNARHTLFGIRKFLVRKLKHDYSSYVEFLYFNCFLCSLLMQSNIYINSLNRLLSAISKCEPILCHELIEMNNIFSKKPDYELPIVCSIVEIIFGNIIKPEQWDKINSIYSNYNNPNNKWEVHQFMMGKGKSSIITPMLLSMLFLKGERNIILVVPEHLKKQTINTLYEYNLFLGIYPKIWSDNDIKLEFLNKTQLSIRNSVLVIDEFDFMYNPLQSNFNKIELAEKLADDKIERVFTLVDDMLIKGKKYISIQYKVVYEINNILSDSNNIKNVTFGMSEIYDYRYCIPYMRKDSPNEGSKFSSILLTMVLTILYFYDVSLKKYILEEKDIIFAFKNKKLIKKLLRLYNINEIELDNILYDFRQINKDNMPIIPEIIMKEYAVHIFSELKKSLIIGNCSFIDIINMNSKWQVGYSGTVNINMNFPVIQNDIKYNSKIIEDKEERINVKLALTNNPNNPNIHIINNNDTLKVFDIVIDNHYSVLIDACAFLKDYDNKIVAEILYNKSLIKGKKKTIIYLLKDDTKMIYNGNHYLYQEKMYKTNEVIYYYSQRHIVGIDFKQPNILNGLILINNTNVYTDVSQAIYRMRKLNKGHTVKICYVSSDKLSINSSSDVYDLINDNEKNINKQNYPMLFYQYFKFFVRKFFTKNWIEVDLNIFGNTPNMNTVFRKIYYNLFSVKYISTNPTVNNTLALLKISGDYRDYIKRIQAPMIEELIRQFFKFDLDTLLKLVFNTNSIQKEVLSETQTQIETVREQQIIASSDNKFSEIYRRISFKYNPLYDLDLFIREFTYLELILGINMLVFSYNLIKNIPGKNVSFIIKLNPNIYLLDHISVFSHYVYMCPIYNLNGQLINHFVFTNEPKTIDFSKIFNFKLTNIDTYSNINIGYIIFGITDDTNIITVEISALKMHDIKVLMALSNVDIFKTNDPELVNITKDINLLLEYYSIPKHRIFTLFGEKVKLYTLSLMDFYKNIPNNKTTDNNKYIPRVQSGNDIHSISYHDMVFTLNTIPTQTEVEYIQVATNI